MPSLAPLTDIGQRAGKGLSNAWSYISGQCTAFVAKEATWIPAGLGNAADWLHNAQIKGFATTATPTVGSVVVYGRGHPYDIANGHVAVVTKVLGPGLFTVDEQNYDGRGSIRRGRTSGMADVIGFILPPGVPAGSTTGTTAPLSIPNPLDAVGGAITTIGNDLKRGAAVFVGVVIALVGIALLLVPELKKAPVPVPLP